MASKVKVFLAVIVIVFTSISCPGHSWLSGAPATSTPSVWRCYENGQKQMVKVPGFQEAWQIVENCNEFPAAKTSISMVFFYAEWKKTFGDFDSTVERALDKIMVEYSNDKKTINAYDVTGQYIENANVVGLALTPSVVWIKVRDEKFICKTSLVHELVHIAIWARKKTDADPDHLGPKYHGWTVEHSALIQRVNNQLCELGI